MNNIKLIKLFSISISILILIVLSLFSIFKLDLVLIILPILITIVFSLPFLLVKKIDLFSIWSFIFYSVFFGVLLRCLHIYFSIPNINRINQVFLLGENKSFLIPSMFLILFGSICLVIGFIFTKKKINFKRKIFTYDEWSEKRFFILTPLLMVISLLALVLFINLQGGLFSIKSISNYRGVSTNLSDTATYSYLRVIISLSGINFLLLYTWLLNYKKRKRIASILLVFSFCIFIFYNFYVSQRAAVFFMFVNIIALSYYFNNFKLPKKKVILALIPALLFFQIMSTIREDFTSIEDQDVNFSFLKSIEPAVLTTNMIDVSKTAHIIKAIPNKLDYEYGYTLTTALFAWVPRFLWKSKPVTNVDNTIGMKVFGSKTYGSGGVPPGIFAELYWNFWIPGVLIGCFLIGKYLKIVHLTFIYYNSNKNSVLIYVIVFMMNGIWLIGSSFSSVLIGLLTTLFPLIWILNFITIRSNNIKQ